MTIHNEDDIQYRLAVHIVPDVNTRNEIAFRATDAGGERRYTSPGDLRSGATYRNVTVSHENSSRAIHTVAPAATTSVTVDEWNRGAAIAALIETTDGSSSLIALNVMTCERASQTMSITVDAGEQTKTSSQCP